MAGGIDRAVGSVMGDVAIREGVAVLGGGTMSTRLLHLLKVGQAESWCAAMQETPWALSCEDERKTCEPKAGDIRGESAEGAIA